MAGGGTRIKILEAFSFRRPVITTTTGVEGISTRTARGERPDRGRTAEQFAQACERLRHEAGLGERLAENAFSLLNRSYSAEATQRTIAAFSWPPSR